MGQRVIQIETVQAHTGVGQCKQRHHAERYPRVQRRLNTLHRRQYFPLSFAQLLEGRGDLLGPFGWLREPVHQLVEGAFDGFQRAFPGGLGIDGGHQAKDHPGERRVHAGLEQAKPHDSAWQQVDRRLADAHALEHQHQGQPAGSNHQAHVVEAGGEKDRDDQNRHDVIDDRQGQQQDAYATRNRFAQQRKHTHGKGDVGRGGDCPATRGGGVVVEQGVDECGHQHTAQRRAQGQRGQLQVGEGAVFDFLADLGTDHQKENGHQPVIHQKMQGARHAVIAQPEGDGRVPEMLVGRGGGAVGPHQRDDGGEQQHDTADGFDV